MRFTRPSALRAAAGLVLCAGAATGALPHVAGAQFAGVPPRPPRPAPPVVAAARDSVSSIQRARDSVVISQRLDIQAWVDSAAPALARQPAAPRDSASRPRADSTRVPGPTAAARPAVRHSAGAVVAAAAVGGAPSVAADRRGWYFRPCPPPSFLSRSD